MKRIHCLKAGTFLSEDGSRHTFTDADVRSIAASYDPQLSEAPIVIGHPATEDQAWGWVGKVEANADGLFVEPREVQPQFNEAVAAGRYKKVSVALYGPTHPGNPKPGGWYLRHLGFLGAKPPAVKGLQPVQFAGSDTGLITVCLADPDDMQVAGLFRRLRNFLVKQHGQQQADETIPEDTILSLESAARTEPSDDTPSSTTTPVIPSSGAIASAALAEAALSTVTAELDMPDPKLEVRLSEAENLVKTLQDQLAEKDAAIKAAADKEAAAASTARRASLAAFAESQVKAGRLLPAEQNLIVELAARIEDGVTVQFSEGGEKVDLAAALRTFIEGLPKRVALGEHVKGEPAGSGVATFAAPPGYTVNAERADLDAKAREYQRAHPNTDYMTAINAVQG